MSRTWTRITLCLAVILILAGIGVGGVYLYRTLRPRPRPDIHKLGGTVLIFAVDEDDERSAAYQPDELAAALKRRLDPHDARGITVRLLDPKRIEIGIPQTERHDEQLDRVKILAAQTGLLEFRILANSRDDRDAIEVAETYLRRAAEEEKVRKGLEDRAARGQPPPPPVSKEGFVSVQGHIFTYTWMELAPHELQSLHLLGADEEGLFKPMRESVAAGRDKGEAVRLPYKDWLLYSRPCRNRKLTDEERKQKQYDWFLLCRDPERDLLTGESKEVTGAAIENARIGDNSRGDPAVHIQLNARAGERFYELTSQNKPDPGEEGLFRRHLAIILDGRIMSAPSLNGPIRDAAEISGGFTARDVEDLVIMLRAGSLPVRLRPAPIEERTVAPNEAPAS